MLAAESTMQAMSGPDTVSRGATGAVSLVLFTAALVLGILVAGRAGVPGLPRAGTQRLHRSLSLVAISFLAVHVVTAIADGYVDITWWDVLLPFGAGYDPFWVGLGTVAVACALLTSTVAWIGWPVSYFLGFIGLGAVVLSRLGVNGTTRRTDGLPPRVTLPLTLPQSGSSDRRAS